DSSGFGDEGGIEFAAFEVGARDRAFVPPIEVAAARREAAASPPVGTVDEISFRIRTVQVGPTDPAAVDPVEMTAADRDVARVFEAGDESRIGFGPVEVRPAKGSDRGATLGGIRVVCPVEVAGVEGQPAGPAEMRQNGPRVDVFAFESSPIDPP